MGLGFWVLQLVSESTYCISLRPIQKASTSNRKKDPSALSSPQTVANPSQQDQLVLQMLHLMELVWQERVRVRLPRGRSAVRERLTKCCTCSRFRRARVLLRSHVATFVVRSVCSFVPERVLPCGPDDARTEERLPKEENDMLRFVPYRDPSQTRHA